MKKMFELEVGETTTVTVEAVDLGYATVDGVEYFVKGIDEKYLAKTIVLATGTNRK